MNTKIKLKRGLAADIYIQDPVLEEGEICIETDTGRAKFGDGATSWIQLPYMFYNTTEINNFLSSSVVSNTNGIVGASGIYNIVAISQTNYNNIPTKDPNTLYFII